MPTSLTEILKNVFLKFPDREAIRYSVIDHDIVIKYFELKNYSNIVAENLNKVLQSCSSSKNQYIGVCLDVTYTFPCVINGILSSGCAFVPLDYLNGLRWNENVLKKLNIKYIITNRLNCDIIRKTKIINSFVILEEEIYIAFTEYEESSGEWDVPMAYSVQTSGSTGTPKLIRVPNQCILPNILDLSSLFKITEADEVFFSSPPTFDPSVVELLLALANGACLRIVESKSKRDFLQLADILFPAQGGTTTILPMTPSLFKQWPIEILTSKVFSNASNIRILLLGGEKCPPLSEIKDWNIRKGITVYNIYGISEVSCWAAISQVWPQSNPPSNAPDGKSCSNLALASQTFLSPLTETVLQVRNIDENNIGSMFIGSSTRVCLIDDEDPSLLKGQLVFRDTGDIFEERNGAFSFIGRSGDVVKRWGVKTSLSALETHALSQGSVKSSACVARITDECTSIGLFIVPKENFNLDEFYEYFCRNGSHTHPDSVIILQKIPVTSHGKINKKFLLELMSKEKSCLDSTDLFNLLWRQYTLCERVIVDKGFLSSGGNSFSALQLVSEFKQLWQLPDSFLSHLLQDSTFNRCLSEVISLSRVNDLSSTKGRKRKIIENDSSPKSTKGSPVRVREHAVHLHHPNQSPKHGSNEISFNLNTNWKYCLDKCVDSSPTVVELDDGRIFIIIGSHSGKVAVIDCENGSSFAEIVLPDRVESTASVHRLKDKFTLGCYDGCIYTFSLTCEKIWCFKTRDIVKSSPIISGDSVICGSYDKCIYCLESETGELIWKRPVGGQVLSKPLIVGNNIIVSTLTGSVTSLTLDEGLPAWTTSLMSPVFSSPVLLSNKIIVADVLGNLGWLHIHTGDKLIEYKAGGNIFSSVTPFNDSILMCCDDFCIYCLKGNQLVWKTKLDSRLVSTPCVFTLINRKLIAVVSSEGKLYLLNASTGSILACNELPGQVFSSPVFVSDSIIVGCRDNYLHSIKINTVC